MVRYLFIFFLLSAFKLQAQVCTGSLGDPTGGQNFGSGVNIGPSLAGVNTNYNYRNGDCPVDGQYVIINKTSNCFSSTWHSLNEDHTAGDTNGYMMLVNANNTSGVFYTFSVDNLCPNTTYEFSSFIINMLNASTVCSSPISRPQVTFRVETESGVVINTYSTGLIYETYSPEWKKYGFFFKIPVNVTKVVLKLINNTTGGLCGNDLALDDISFRPCGPTILAETVGISSGNNLQLCEGATGNYNFNADISSGFSTLDFVWQVDKNDGLSWVDVPSSNTKNLNVQIANADIKGYTYRMAAAEIGNITSVSCRVFSNPIYITVNPKVTLDPLKDLYVLENTATKINASASGASNLTYKWSPSTFLDNPTILQPTATATLTTTYKLVATDPLTGCAAEDEMTIYVDPNIIIPNSFTPNGDGVNDYWKINGIAIGSDVDISVFNRDGQIVFQSKGYTDPWDGQYKNTPLATGVYYYIIDSHSHMHPVYKGSLLLIK